MIRQRKDVAKDVVKAVKKRIQHKKPTVQFFALTVYVVCIFTLIKMLDGGLKKWNLLYSC